MNPLLPQDSKTSKGWFDTPEKKTQAILWALAIGVGIYFWGSIVRFLLSAALDTLHLIIVGCVIAALLAILTSKRVHYIGHMISRWITGWFVAIDPIGIRKTYVEETEKKKSDLDASTSEIRGLRVKLGRRLDENRAAFQKSMRALDTATAILQQGTAPDDKRRTANRIMTSESKHSDGLGRLIAKQEAHLSRYDLIINVLARYGEVCDDTILDLKREIEIQEQEQEESRGFSKGMRSAFGILRGFGEDREMDSMATVELERQYSKRMGEVEGFLEMTKDVISKADFNDEAALASVQKRLEAWSSKDSGLQIGRPGESKGELISAASPEHTEPLVHKK